MTASTSPDSAPDTGDPQSVLDALTEFTALEPGMLERVLATHVPNQYGNCASCSGQLRQTPWPCVHHYCALKAQELLDRAGRKPR
jgi:hypothetical protein